MDFIYNENLWSIGHLILWILVGRFLLKNWLIFIILSLGWELIEYLLPYEVAKEVWGNRASDVIINTLGFYIGNRIRKRAPKN